MGDYDDTDDVQKKEHTRESLAIQNLMKNEDSRAFVYNHLQSCGVFANIWDKDPLQHAYNAGRRSAGLMLDRDIKDAEPAYYLKMIEENIDG